MVERVPGRCRTPLTRRGCGCFPISSSSIDRRPLACGFSFICLDFRVANGRPCARQLKIGRRPMSADPPAAPDRCHGPGVTSGP
jgi:hypothetical protein